MSDGVNDFGVYGRWRGGRRASAAVIKDADETRAPCRPDDRGLGLCVGKASTVACEQCQHNNAAREGIDGASFLGLEFST
jgi:hypothetical protein